MPEEEDSYCFNLSPHQSASTEVQVGQDGPVNGHECRASVEVLALCPNEQGILILKLRIKSKGELSPSESNKHAVTIVKGLKGEIAVDGKTDPIFTGDHVFDCSKELGTQEIKFVKSQTSLGKFHVKIADTVFMDRIRVSDVATIWIRSEEGDTFSPYPKEFSNDGGGLGPNVFIQKAFSGRGQLGVAPTGSGNSEYDTAPNLVEIVGIVCDSQQGDIYRWKRMLNAKPTLIEFKGDNMTNMLLTTEDAHASEDGPPAFAGDIKPSATNKLYDADNPRIPAALFESADDIGEVIILKTNFTQTLYRTRGGVEKEIAAIKWHSINTMVRKALTGKFNEQWGRTSIDEVGEGEIELSVTKEAAQKIIGKTGTIK